MRVFLLGPILLFLCINSLAQNLDLIVTRNNDSIACNIDSITAENIYFTTQVDYVKHKTFLILSNVYTYEFNSVNKRKIFGIPGTIYFRSKQSSPKDINTNSIYITPAIGYYAMATLNYELILSQEPTAFFKMKSLFVGGGIDVALGEGIGYHIHSGFTGLSGSGKNHFELGLGIAAIFDKYNHDFAIRNTSSTEPAPPLSNNLFIFPNITVGFRRQKPNKQFLFRTGIGWPEMAYFGFGYRF